MSILNQIAHFQNRRDQGPNKELAKELVETNDLTGIQEIAANLWNEDLEIRCDCLSVMEEIGNQNPVLIAGYAGELLKLAKSKNNRLRWGSLIPLSRIAHLRADEIFPHLEDLLRLMDKGSVIVVDNAVKILAVVAADKDAYRERIFPHLLQHLGTCRPKDVPQHAESIFVATNAENKNVFIEMLEKRMVDMSSSQAKRLKKVISQAGKR